MNKGLLALNGVLGVGVIILFWLHFSSSTATNSINNTANNDSTLPVLNDSLSQYLNLDSNIAAKPIKIAYVNSDSLDKNLKMLSDVETEIAAKEKELADKIAAEQRRYQSKFESKVKNFEKARKDYALKGPTMTDAQLQEQEKKLQQMQQDIANSEQKYQVELMQFQAKQEEEYVILKAKKMSDYYKKVQGYCESIANRLGFDFILIYQQGGAILYANQLFDISKYVIDAINKEYDDLNGIENSSESNANS